MGNFLWKPQSCLSQLKNTAMRDFHSLSQFPFASPAPKVTESWEERQVFGYNVPGGGVVKMKNSANVVDIVKFQVFFKESICGLTFNS